MPFTTEAFLDALGLPAEHPYATNYSVEAEELKGWSIADYFSSVSTSPSRLSSNDECAKSSPPPWSIKKLGNHDGIVGIHGDFHMNPLNDDKVRFLEEVKPCLISMCHMSIILWAPLVLFLCVKRLSRPHTQHLSDSKPRPKDYKSFEKKGDGCLLGLHVRENPVSKQCCSSHKRQTSPECKKHNMSVDRYLFMISFITTFVSALSVAAPFFSFEERKIKQHLNVPASKHTHSCESNQSHLKGLGTSTIADHDWFSCCGDWLAYLTALVVSTITMTDAMYIYEFSYTKLLVLHLLIICMAMKRLGSRAALLLALPFTSASISMMRRKDLDLPSIQPGLYYDETNPVISKAVQNYWPVQLRSYDEGTPWMITGDVRTGLPFLLYSPPGVEYIRRWVPLPDENEAVILDIAFPGSGIVVDNKTVYLVLHGINGHSDEGYVLDFVRQQIAEGNIVAVMVTRGLMDSPILGTNLLHFARTSDVSAAAKALKTAISNMRDNSSSAQAYRPMLAGVGYSMGAITLANYVARTGKDCDLDVAIGFSGSLDTREQVSFARSASLWQPFIAKAMRDTLLRKFMKQIEQKFTQEQLIEIMKAKSLVDLDRAFFAPYNNFESLDDYYSHTGAMGDFVSFDGKEGRIANVSIPLCMVQSLDDPVGTWRSFHDPQKVAATGSGSTLILITRTGGHVGWPLGMNPRIHGWSWMSSVAASFVDAIRQARTM